jgi:type II secretory pathway component PulJ
MKRRCNALRQGPGGFAYVEVLVALVLVAVALVPALEALQSGVIGSGVLVKVVDRDALLRAKMEEVLARPFDALNAETFLGGGNTSSSVSAALSDAVGTANRRLVILYRTDGTALSAADTGLLRIRVVYEVGGTALETMKSKWW